MFRSPLHPRSRRGVTLIEVVISIFVLSVGIVGILSLFPTGYRLTRKSVERSIAALAARHAVARVYGCLNNIKAPDLALEPLSKVPENLRTGTIKAVNTNSLQCAVMGGQSPKWSTNCNASLAGYFIVMTTGSAEGHLYPITSSTDDVVNVGSGVRFNVLATEKEYEQVRVGDCFAIIGIKSASATQCYPARFLGGSVNAVSDPVKGADPEKDETRTMPVATYGDATQPKDQWRYSYGCILSAPAAERPEMCRLDVFVYSGFPYRAPAGDYPDPSVANSQVVGRYVTYIPVGKKQQP